MIQHSSHVFFLPSFLFGSFPDQTEGVFFSLMNYPQTQESHLFKMPPILTQHQPAPPALFYQSLFPNSPRPHPFIPVCLQTKKGEQRLCVLKLTTWQSQSQDPKLMRPGHKLTRGSGQKCDWKLASDPDI